MHKDLVQSRDGEYGENILAIAVSLAIHLLAVIWIFGFTQGTVGGASDSEPEGIRGSMTLQFLAEDEFRQRVELIPAPPNVQDSSESVPSSVRQVAALVHARDDVSESSDSTLLAEAKNVRPVAGLASHASLDGFPRQEVDAVSSIQSGQAGGDSALRTQYLGALRLAIQKQWGNAGYDGDCSLRLRQVRGGGLEAAISLECDLDVAARRSLEAAALMAQPMPYAGYESVFSDDLIVRM